MTFLGRLQRVCLAVTLLGTLLVPLPISSALAQPCARPACAVILPADAGALNVRDFGAKGDGTADDTAAFLAAATASGGDTGETWWHDRIIQVPAGTYRVTGSIVKRYRDGGFGSGLSLLGEGPGRTIIRLADHSPGFQDRSSPRGVVMTTSKRLDSGGSRDYVHKGEGNDAYENFVEGLTIDVGESNPGAVGIDYLANNVGAIRDVVVQGRGESGAIGIAMNRLFAGPALIQATQVNGFRTGIAISGTEYGMTLSDVVLDGQGDTGLLNDGNAVSAERLTIHRSGKAGVTNAGSGGLITLVDSDVGAIVGNRGTIVLRSTRASLPGAAATETSIDGVLRPDATLEHRSRSWSVPRVMIPTVDPGPSRAWVGVTGATGDHPVDTTQALQHALNSGARTIYLRQGTFWLSKTINVPASVHRIIGMNSTLRVFPQRQPGFAREAPMILVGESGEPLEIDRLALDNSYLGSQLGIRNDARRQLLLRDIVSAGVVLFDRTARGGMTALEDVCCSTIQVAGPEPVTARQFDTEGGGVRIDDHGTPLSIIGLKTEQESTVVSASDGGRVEILGGLVYMVGAPKDPATPLFVSRNSHLDASFVEEVLRPGHAYSVYVRQEDAGQRSEMNADAMPKRGMGRMVDHLGAGPR